MATAFLLWSSSASAGDADATPPPETKAPSTAPATKQKPRRAPKPSAPKRPPQRGLGVAQLERLRLQERWKTTTESDPSSPREIHPTPLLHLPVPFPGSSPHAPPPPPTALCYLHRSSLSANLGLGLAPSAQSLLHDHYPADRWRIAAPDPLFHLPEPPSNQKIATTMQCFSDQCEFCATKKRLFGENPTLSGINGVDYLEMDLAAAVAVDQVRRTPLPSQSNRTYMKDTAPDPTRGRESRRRRGRR
ncbi:uncharacterized protein LOC109712304 isoform X2 [Ananas comosus]|uniref:Uncharacterized protein LOC109712304 isoform X2 n=1 Tax=Ananas comosus TaxID=4615 RepID=A0A6P5FDK6_ANACO|nr:uncharacterized protein LOC109712304 isoform X2 [Ananas comosus]